MKTEDIEICKDISRKIIENVELKIMGHIGNPESGELVKLGADGTPTAYIDLIAENEVIDVLIDNDFISLLISEEIGEIKIGKGLVEYVNVSDELKKISKRKKLNTISDENIPKFIFLVDPLDGTSNAIKNIGAYGISIAVFGINHGVVTLDDVELGFVKNFANGHFYEAIKGKGAWLNGKIMIPSKETNLSNLSIGGFIKNNNYDVFDLVKKVRRMRILGSVVLELAYVANAKYDAFIDMRGSRIIDIAASKLIIEESGAIVTDENGNRLKNSLGILEKTIVVGAGNKELHKRIINIINKNKSNNIEKVGIVSRLDKDEAILFGAKLIQILEEKGIDISIEDSLANKLNEMKNSKNIKDIRRIIDDFIKKDGDLVNESISFEGNDIRDKNYIEINNSPGGNFAESNDFNFADDYDKYVKDISKFKTDVLITLGGDGTLLRGQANLSNYEIPLLGINLGTVGFLTELDIGHAFDIINHILKGEYYKEKRTQLKVSHGKEIFTALNEVVIMTEMPAKMLNFEVSVDGEVVEEFRADGLILSTPSGSTAYSMSAGGPIVDPRVGAFIIIPICPYKLGLRPFVVSDMSEIKVKLLKKGKKAVLVMDGQVSEEIGDSEEINFVKSENDVYFIRTTDKYFYQRIKEKLTEGGSKPTS